MITKEEIKQECEKMYAMIDFTSSSSYNAVLAALDAYAAISGKEENEKGGWVSVEDRLPEFGETVLVFQAERCEIKTVGKHNSGPYTDFTQKEFYNKITHWQPLPPSPDTEKG